jgi:hypothetical protein
MSVTSRTTREVLPDSLASARTLPDGGTGEKEAGRPGLEQGVGLAAGAVLVTEAVVGVGEYTGHRGGVSPIGVGVVAPDNRAEPQAIDTNIRASERACLIVSSLDLAYALGPRHVNV